MKRRDNDKGEFAASLSAIGKTAIWSANFAQTSPEQAIEAARAVSAALGPPLFALEIGNEADACERAKSFPPPPQKRNRHGDGLPIYL
ncbi:MAG: hypothetical protein ACLGQX_10755 [Acidobacteriota bacterium]